MPGPIGEWLIGPGGLGLTTDAGRDVLRLEARLRATAAALQASSQNAEEAVAAARDAVRRTAQPGRCKNRRDGRLATGRLRQAILSHSDKIAAQQDAQALVDILRGFVIALGPEDGELRGAADGWSRSPAAPASIVGFADENTFLAADSRRGATSAWGGTVIGGVEEFGHFWRRDGDDDPEAENWDQAGPWSLGYIEQTTEIYAARRVGGQPHEVWLLGSGFAKRRAFALLGRVAARMREPNSVILAAGVVQAARGARPTRQCVALRVAPPATSNPDNAAVPLAQLGGEEMA
ncbi:hypothetical protein ACIA5G_39800 [Amycolatopsis sp. NPDC051758]|uniref:hypothetical protein n=1 Tax=Amycolatopsis sp. NPDC051758 TaxID=3363935 RepID=UPI0037A7A72A